MSKPTPDTGTPSQVCSPGNLDSKISSGEALTCEEFVSEAFYGSAVIPCPRTHAQDHAEYLRKQKAREDLFEKWRKPIVGDIVELPNGDRRRVAHCWPEGAQLSSREYGSIYICEDGQGSYSGGLIPIIPYAAFRNTGRLAPSRMWFFSCGLPGASRSVSARYAVHAWTLDQRELAPWHKKYGSYLLEETK